MREKLSLEELQDFFSQSRDDRVFLDHNRVTKPMMGKYLPGITYQFENSFVVSEDGKLYNPLYGYTGDTVKEYVEGMGIRFNQAKGENKIKILTGEMSKTKNGGVKFRLKPPTKSRDVLINVSWGGSFERALGSYDDYAKQSGAMYYRKASSSAGRLGNDYWILPVGKVLNAPDRDVSAYMSQIEEAARAQELAAERVLNERNKDSNEIREFINKNRDTIESLMKKVAELKVEVSSVVEDINTKINSTLEQKYTIDYNQERYDFVVGNEIEATKSKLDYYPMNIRERTKNYKTEYYIGPKDSEIHKITKDIIKELQNHIKEGEDVIKQAKELEPDIMALAEKAAENGQHARLYCFINCGINVSPVYFRIRELDKQLDKENIQKCMDDAKLYMGRFGHLESERVVTPKEINLEDVSLEEIDYENAYLKACESRLSQDQSSNEKEVEFERD